MIDTVGTGIILNYQGQQKYFQTGFATPEVLYWGSNMDNIYQLFSKEVVMVLYYT